MRVSTKRIYQMNKKYKETLAASIASCIGVNSDIRDVEKVVDLLTELLQRL